MHFIAILPIVSSVILGKIGISENSAVLIIFSIVLFLVSLFFLLSGMKPNITFKERLVERELGGLDGLGGLGGHGDLGDRADGPMPANFNFPARRPIALDIAAMANAFIAGMPARNGQGGADEAHIIFDIRPFGPQRVERRDANNVHDHEIQNGIKHSIKLLREWSQGADSADGTDVHFSSSDKKKLIASVKKYIFDKFDGEYTVKEMAYSTIRVMEKSNGYVDSIQMKELEVLNLVWKRIHADVNADNVEELRSNLVTLLADSSINVDSPYCLIGRVTRVIQALQCLDAEDIITLRSTDTVKEEVSNKVPLIIAKYFEGRSSDKTEYDNGSEQVAQELQRYVKRVLSTDYLDSNILTEPTFNEIAKPYLDEIVA